MGKEQTATFIGHKECYGVQTEEVQREIEKIIALGVTDFLNGGMGGFDWMCARIVYDLKKSYPQIKNYLVIPYLTFNIAEPKYFDATIYPEGFEKYHFKAAIPARNRYLVDNSTYAICYVTHDWGGAAKHSNAQPRKDLQSSIWEKEKMGEIIYKKQFHREPIDETEPEVANFADNGNAPSFDEIMKEIYSNVTYLVLPGREKEARHFIQKAIEISNDYELDIEIREHLSHISATYSFDCCACMGFLKSIIEMTDDISFFDHIGGYDLVMSLDFYTKAVFKRGRLIQPKWSDLSE